MSTEFSVWLRELGKLQGTDREKALCCANMELNFKKGEKKANRKL